MSMQRVDIQHHTPEQVADYLREAQRIVSAADILPEEAVAVLPTLVTLISSKSVHLQQPQAVTLPTMAIPGNRRHA